MPPKIIIADDHPLFRTGLRQLVQRQTTAQIIEVADTQTLMAQAGLVPLPDAMFLDLVFPGFNGVASILQIRKDFPLCALIVVSMNDAPDVVEQIMAAGANGFISKAAPPDKMAAAISGVLEGGILVCLDAETSGTQDQLRDISVLTPRQREVLLRLGRGKTTKEIARELEISPFTARAHISAVFKTLGVTTRSAAAAIAVQSGLT